MCSQLPLILSVTESHQENTHSDPWGAVQHLCISWHRWARQDGLTQMGWSQNLNEQPLTYTACTMVSPKWSPLALWSQLKDLSAAKNALCCYCWGSNVRWPTYVWNSLFWEKYLIFEKIRHNLKWTAQKFPMQLAGFAFSPTVNKSR